jgi:F-type H+-transporting ATPase subunit a
MAQFEIHDLSPTLFQIAGQPVAFTNSTLYMLLAVVCATALMVFAARPKALVPGRLQMAGELFYNFIAGLVIEGAGDKAKPFIPFVFTIFSYIFFCNLLGLVPTSLTVTAHLVVNFALAAGLIAVVIIAGLKKHGFHFLKLFVPGGVPFWLLPIITMIEIVSFFIRPCSLAIRLFANMMAGHILLKILAGMAASLVPTGWLVSTAVFPVMLNIIILIFELVVAFLQAYIFSILASVYLRDATETH